MKSFFKKGFILLCFSFSLVLFSSCEFENENISESISETKEDTPSTTDGEPEPYTGEAPSETEIKVIFHFNPDKYGKEEIQGEDYFVYTFEYYIDIGGKKYVQEIERNSEYYNNINIENFDGWYFDIACTVKYSEERGLDETTDLYAKWNKTVTVTSLEINESYLKKEYINEDLDTSNLMVQANYSNGSSRLLNTNEYEITTNFNKDVVGNYTVTITAFGESISYVVYVKSSSIDDGYISIGTVEEFINFRKKAKDSGKYKLTSDIDLSGVTLEETLINFSGEFDGHGYTIKNAIYDGDRFEKSGIVFKKLEDAIVTNIKFENCVARSNADSIAIVAGLANGETTISKIEFNNCSAKSEIYPALVCSRTYSSEVKLTISEITVKNGSYTECRIYAGTLIADIWIDESSTNRPEVIIENCDLDVEIKGGDLNGGFLSGRIRQNANLTIKNVVIRNAVVGEGIGLICGGGFDNGDNSTVTVENLYVQNTNATLLQSVGTEVDTFNITYKNSYVNSLVASITDNKSTYLQSVNSENVDINWIKNTLKLDFSETGPWQVEENDATKFRLKASTSNVASN